ncbi:hypothetical protein TCAL_17249 [Tigriopus californicus]|uniref:Uncharacterized protein n=1 Tax=Tigriopus californicus TaxID=6832 RepID=A0A553NZV2_TIGCA|nr:hypothetical protein TCAL_17249 [Tigriopus californicus]
MNPRLEVGGIEVFASGLNRGHGLMDDRFELSLKILHELVVFQPVIDFLLELLLVGMTRIGGVTEDLFDDLQEIESLGTVELPNVVHQGTLVAFIVDELLQRGLRTPKLTCKYISRSQIGFFGASTPISSEITFSSRERFKRTDQVSEFLHHLAPPWTPLNPIQPALWLGLALALAVPMVLGSKPASGGCYV